MSDPNANPEPGTRANGHAHPAADEVAAEQGAEAVKPNGHANGNGPGRRLQDLFIGYELAHARFKLPKTSGDGTKVEGGYRTIHAPLTETEWAEHITASGDGILVIPLRKDSTVRFGALDIDVYPLDFSKVEQIINEHQLPLTITRSKSGGAHLWIFVTEPGLPAIEMAETLTIWRELFAEFQTDREIEVFPKQTKRDDPTDTGNGINIPFFDAKRTMRYGFRGGDNITNLDAFLTVVTVLTPEAFRAIKVVPPHKTKRQEQPAGAQASTSKERLDPGDPADLLFQSPPCLQTIIKTHGGFPEGTRGEGLYNVGVYLRKRYPDGDEWQDKLKDANQKLCKPPLTNVQVRSLIRSLSRKEYRFKCKLPPIREFCNKQLCQTRDFGIGPPPSADWTERLTQRMEEINGQHFVLQNDGGKCLVAEWMPSEISEGSELLSFQTFSDFRNRYCNQVVQVGVNGDNEPIWEKLGKWWLDHPDRRQYRGLVFRPGRPTGDDGDGYLNLWRGFAVTPKPGNWLRMRKHIKEVLANGEEESDTYIIRWIAWALQNPDEPAEVAIVFKGEEGTGKGTLIRAIMEIFGQHGFHARTPKQLTNNFNAHLRDCCLLYADEAIRPADKTAANVIKALLTEPTKPIEYKGRDVIQAKNHVKVMMSSNDDWVAQVGKKDRRFAVFAVSEKHAKNATYFKALREELDNGGQEAMLHDLLHLDLGDWHPRDNIPNTEARNAQKIASLGGFEKLFLDFLTTGDIPVNALILKGRDKDKLKLPFVATVELHAYVQNTLGRDECSMNDISKLLIELFGEEARFRKRNTTGYTLPPLPEARIAWDKHRPAGSWDQGINAWSPFHAPTGISRDLPQENDTSQDKEPEIPF